MSPLYLIGYGMATKDAFLVALLTVYIFGFIFIEVSILLYNKGKDLWSLRSDYMVNIK